MENLLFFNKKGNLYNFTYNDDKWEGKIIFDENASDTFRTTCIYIFENVNPIEYVSSSDFLKLTYYDNSGITFTKKVPYQNISDITNIEKVNNSAEFYSKWISGENFNTKFPTGTIIKFDNVTGDTSYYSDFDNSKFFTVVEAKKDAIMIITDTNNSVFSFTFSAGTISKSLNVISINDYNRNLDSENFLQNLYNGKKLSILNTTYNDKIIDIISTGLTYSYINDIKITGSTDDIFKLRLYLLTERPKIYKGNSTITKDYSGNVIVELDKLNSNFSVGTDFTFGVESGEVKYSGYSFTVNSIESSRVLGDKQINFIKREDNILIRSNIIPKTKTIDYRLEFNGYLDLTTNDKIYLSATTLTNHLNHNREFNILDSVFINGVMTVRVKGYLISETGNTYNITKILNSYQKTKMNVTPSGIIPNGYSKTENDIIIYSTSNHIDFTQTILKETGITYYNTIKSFLIKYESTLNNFYGIDSYYAEKNLEGYLSIESKYGTYHPYIYASGFTNDVKLIDDHSLSNNGITERYNIISNTNLTNERTYRYNIDILSRNSSTSILLNLNYNTSNYGFKYTLNGNEYFTRFSGDTQSTIDTFINKYYNIFYHNGFNVYSGYTSGVYSGYSFNVVGLSSDVNIWESKMSVNLLSTYHIIEHKQNRGIILSGNEIRSNAVNYFDIGLSTGMIINISGSSFNDNNKDYNIIGLTQDKIQLSYQGVFFDDNSVSVLGKTREFLRKPRGFYNKDVYFKVSWVPINDRETLIDETIFFYDISGEQLKPYKNIENLRYTGQLPLISATGTNNVVYLNDKPNDKDYRINNPKYQQTVFNDLEYKLEQLDSSSDYNWVPQPLTFYIGYNSKIEGVNNNIFKIEKIEKIQNTDTQFIYSGYTTIGSVNNFYFSGDTVIYENSFVNFMNYGFEVGQSVLFRFKDQSLTNQMIFQNINTYKIISIGRNSMKLDSSVVTFNTTGSTFHFSIEVQPKEIARFSIYGQTEIEDIRFKINLNNVGVQISDDTAKIFKEADIKDNAVNYTLLNRKRKEMLTNYREIYDYIGSYKSLVNAINYFGYNDLQLYEYYRNIDKTSQLYKKLSKVLIPDIFDNTVEGWNEIDFIAGKYQNKSKWTKTNLFNLTYRITDEEGNNTLTYTLDEVQYKLGKLKNWLRQNIIPISANLLDITGVSDSPHTLYQNYDESNQVKKSVVSRESTIVNFNYNSTLNFGSNYLITVNFYVLSGESNAIFSEIPNFFTAKIKTFYLSGTTMIPVQYYKLRKNDLSSYSFNIEKNIDPYIYIETTTYNNEGSGLGITNNKMFYFDEPKNHWLVNHNFDMTKYKYILHPDYIINEKNDIVTYKNYSTVINTSVETNIKINTNITKK